MKVTKKQAYIISGIALIGLGIGAYFVFFRKKKGEYDPSNNATQNHTNNDYQKQLQAFKNGTKIRDLKVSLINEMNKRTIVNKEQIKNLLYDAIPDDEYMKVFKSYFSCVEYKGNLLWFNDERKDLVGWLRETFSSSDFNDLLSKYPSLNYSKPC